MELDDPGFHHSVLADFRERLTQNDLAVRLLDLALARLKEAGLVRERTTQRTDSTHRRQVNCPQGQVSVGWHGPYPTSSPTAAPLIVSRFIKSQCRPCSVRTQCTTTADSARTVGFPPRDLRDLQLRVRAKQQPPNWKTATRGLLRKHRQRVRPRTRRE
ncbi:transposase [Streptomyces regalis]|uniref:Transposase DDE domain-containing protein n=1 Tax=Streptomyces regalis TaxID=68262 RepID=A0A117MMM4_9ACTN|nr:transposase [Streptomyces regalis]KUL25750.1 hypothetical protein ADL12_34135 [Streptomyces regalis]